MGSRSITLRAGRGGFSPGVRAKENQSVQDSGIKNPPLGRESPRQVPDCPKEGEGLDS